MVFHHECYHSFLSLSVSGYRRIAASFLVLLFTTFNSAQAIAYDPLEVRAEANPPTLDLRITDGGFGRSLPVLVYLPESSSPAPIIIFSHGLGGSRKGNMYMGDHFSRRGYIVVFVQHPGSDVDIWKDKRPEDRMNALREAANLTNFMRRARDIPALIDQLGKWNKDNNHPLYGRMDPEHIGMSGHSFGAVTTQAVSGQHFPVIGKSLSDDRIKAAIAYSPSTPKRGGASEAFGTVKIPWMLMTGTHDIVSVGNADLNSRLGVFPALPGGDKYELVLNNAEHSAFTDRSLPGDVKKRNPNHHRAILALSTAFWDAYLKSDKEAQVWLDGTAPSLILEREDRWQRK